MDVEKYEQAIFSLSCDLDRISVLERKSRARLQTVHRNGKPYIRSIKDKYKNIRALLLAAIVHGYQSRNARNIEILKQIVYSSSLQRLTASRGLLKVQLHKNVGECLRAVELSPNVESELIKCFNCVAFFDEVIMSSFREHFVLHDLESFQIWQKSISETFGIDIVLVTSASAWREASGSGVIELQLGSDDGLYLASNYFDSLEIDSIISRSSSEDGEALERKNLMVVSIDCDSPGYSNKENRSRLNTHVKLDKLQRKHTLETKRQLSRSRQQRSSFWSLFCCGAD